MRRAVSVCLLVLASCGNEPGPDVVAKAKPPTADLDLKKASAKLTQTSTTDWTLEKVGTKGASTISWQATATKGTTQSGLLIVNGFFKLQNKGKGAATIGNIVINLQTKSQWWKPWVTRSSVIADATSDDAATVALVDRDKCQDDVTQFTENAASGHLLFTDATTNSAFALVPQVTIPGQTTRKLRFSASYDNTVLQLPTWTLARIEILISFGNAKKGKQSAHDVDINGNGMIDADEEWIQTVDEREYVLLPPAVPSNSTVTLTDGPSDITTTGTVTFSNPLITINGTSATVVVSYDGGASGGTITNCAHLKGTGQTVTVDDDDFPNVMPIDLTACDTQTIGPHACSPGAPGCGWEDGDLVSYAQESWGGDPSTSTAAALLQNRFDFVYVGGVEVGISGPAGFSMAFTSAQAVLAYQPASGANASLNADLLDPTSSAAGTFGGHVLGLQLDVDFADSGDISGTSGLKLGDLRLCGLPQAAYNNLTVRQFLAQMNIALGGGAIANGYSYDAISELTANITSAFEGGAASLFAQQHLVSGATCP